VVEVFLQLDDPYSYLLSQYLPALARHYDVELRVHLSQALREGFQPAPDMLPEYALADSARLARELTIPFLDKGSTPPVEHRRALLAALAARCAEADFPDEVLRVLALYWRGDGEAAAKRTDKGVMSHDADEVIARSQRRLRRLGHYNSAMLYYAGEWYWGVDRLHYLTARLEGLGLARADKPDARLVSVVQATRYSLPLRRPAAARALPPLELFVSFRSPYSYLCLPRVFAIADAFGLKLRLRPVLPMVNRGMQMPMPKLRYIGFDAMREAERVAMPFGRFADPLGAGVERCLAVFVYAESEGRGRDFVMNACEGIWARGIDTATDRGMRKITGRTGLFWPEVKAAMANDDWRAPIEANRESMTACGAWGVPTVRLGDFVCWGQDRDWLLVRHIEELCDTGEGILV